MGKKVEAGLIVILSGPSGSGKTTICSRLMKEGDFDRSVSATTRPPRSGEINGRDYWFMGKKDFLHKAEEGYFAEHAEYCGRLYGTPRKPLEEALAAGRVIFLVIEVDGAQQIREKFPNALSLFVKPPSDGEALNRLRGRHEDAEADIARRSERSRFEMQQADRFDYVVVNEDLDAAVGEVRAIIAAERRARLGSR